MSGDYRAAYVDEIRATKGAAAPENFLLVGDQCPEGGENPDSVVGPFVRGDCDGNGTFGGTPTEAIVLLNFAFLGVGNPDPPFPDCLSSGLESDIDLGCESSVCP